MYHKRGTLQVFRHGAVEIAQGPRHRRRAAWVPTGPTLPRDLPDLGLGAAHGHAEAPSEVSGERGRGRVTAPGAPSGWSRSIGKPTPRNGRCCSRWRQSSVARPKRCVNGGDRALRDGGDSTTWPMADARGRGVSHIGVGGLVQHAAVVRADWRRATGGVRSAIL